MADNKTQIVITAEDRTAAAFASAKSGLEKFSSAYAMLGGLAGVGIAASLVAGVKHIVDFGDEMNDLSQKVGISVKDLATWRLAAEQSGTSLESVAKGVKGLSTYMVENGEALRAAGITATDANGALIELADLFSAMPDGIEKTALAVKLFGKAGMDMIPMLNLGSKGLAEAKTKAADYAQKLEELAPQADKFNDALRELKLQGEASWLTIAGKLTPGMEGLALWIRDARSSAEGLASAIDYLAEKSGSSLLGGLSWLVREGGTKRSIGFTGQKNALGLPLGDLERQAADLAAFDAATAEYMKQREAKQRAKGLLGKEDGKPAAARAVGSVDDYASRVNQAVAGAINSSAVVKSRELADQIEALDKLFFDSGLDMDIYTSAMAKLTGQTDKAGKETDRLMQLLAATPTAKLEETRKDMELLASMLEGGHISENQFIEAAQARLGTLGEAVKEVDTFARDMGLSFSSAFEDAVIGGKSLGDVIKGLGQDIERIILRKTVTEPLGNAVSDAIKGSSFGGNNGLLGGMKNLFGFAGGGSFTVGGAGGTDSQLVAFKATPGEEVSIRTPAQQGGGSVTIHQTVNIDSRSDQASIMQAMVQAKNAAVAEVRNSMRRGGAFA